ncbi:Aconitate hydratase [Thermogutta terrifontis]|uniref:Aconitate hydratase n=1 Tax=Thermogutta terrifontis TaxID=1331910 RepID=A0A286RIE2_9BACT|nr:aconitate hydratase AcnA [Thermogutta terrifontis]ASV75729.1 Aconitate hydratase [Thermogutta terrifontis]
MVTIANDPFQALGDLRTSSGAWKFFRLTRLEDLGLTRLTDLPYSIRILLESVLRQCDGFSITEEDVRRLAQWGGSKGRGDIEVPFKPARVILQDFTGVPALVDLAAMRSAIHRMGGQPSRVNPLIPVDLVIDHSVQVDFFGDRDAFQKNVRLEFERNRERYEFLRWGQVSFANLRVVPPAAGIIHQINLEYLARCVVTNDQGLAYPDTLVGTDSHTTMINGLGVLGWGVGGIEAEAAMLGQPMYMLAPEVVGLELVGELREGVTATDLVLTVTELLRKEGVVGKFVEFFGEAIARMPVYDRAVLANMAPEYGATMGFFPIDDQTLHYLQETGRPAELVELVERYCKEQGLFRNPGDPVPSYTKILRLDLDSVEGSVAGPKRPQDRVPVARLAQSFAEALTAPVDKRGFGLTPDAVTRQEIFRWDGKEVTLGHGSVVIAAITSCTNTSNPKLMIAAGLLAKKACEKGLTVPPYVKTSLAPGSRVVTDYLERLGLLPYLEKLGFAIVGYGCTTCIGNSGPLPEAVAEAVKRGNLVVAAVLSGNRNFEGRIHPLVKANYLASPPLVVAAALAGSVTRDLLREPIGTDPAGQPVYLKDLWPSEREIASAMAQVLTPELFQKRYQSVFEGDELWQSLAVQPSELFPWREESTYIHEPPYFDGLTPEPTPPPPIRGARVLLALGDSVTTDHISPAGTIPKDSPAGRFLIERGVPPEEFNTYGARRGNDLVMVRGTFANIRLRNYLVPDQEGGVTRYWPTGEVLSVFEAAMRYKSSGTPLVVLAGAEYGTGSSRDWAAKGTALLGIRAVLATSFERIHRSNLVGMGVLPLQFPGGQTWQGLGLTGEEVIDILEPETGLTPRCCVRVVARKSDGQTIEFSCVARIDTPVELEYYRHGGILPMVLRKLLSVP